MQTLTPAITAFRRRSEEKDPCYAQDSEPLHCSSKENIYGPIRPGIQPGSVLEKISGTGTRHRKPVANLRQPRRLSRRRCEQIRSPGPRSTHPATLKTRCTRQKRYDATEGYVRTHPWRPSALQPAIGYCLGILISPAKEESPMDATPPDPQVAALRHSDLAVPCWGCAGHIALFAEEFKAQSHTLNLLGANLLLFFGLLLLIGLSAALLARTVIACWSSVACVLSDALGLLSALITLLQRVVMPAPFSQP